MEWRSIDEPGDWRSIVEGDAPPAPPPLRISSRPREIVIRGRLATEPAVYRRRGKVLTVSVLAALLTRFVGWSASIAGHFVLFAVLVGVLFMSKPPEDETYLQVGLHDRNGGNQGQVLAPPQAPVAPEPVKAPLHEPVNQFHGSHEHIIEGLHSLGVPAEVLIPGQRRGKAQTYEDPEEVELLRFIRSLQPDTRKALLTLATGMPKRRR